MCTVDPIPTITKVTVQVQMMVQMTSRVHRATAGHQVHRVHQVHQAVCITKLTHFFIIHFQIPLTL